MAADIIHVGAVGAGRMGRGIAIAFAYAGHVVTLIDLKSRDDDGYRELEKEARAEIVQDLRFLASVGALEESEIASVLALIAFAGGDDARPALAACDLIFEGVPETLAAKADAFGIVSDHVRPDCIVASTTSTMDAATLAPLVTRPERFLNAHWLNPAYLMPLVELSPHAGTDPTVLAKLRAALERIGKVPVVCSGSPGYIVPRIQTLAMNEAARMVEEGVATAEDIDKAVRVGFGLRFSVLGLLEFVDWGGGDILQRASAFLADRLSPRFAAPGIIEDNMALARNGLRDGRGFYDYADVDTTTYRNDRLAEFVSLLRKRELMPRRAGS